MLSEMVENRTKFYFNHQFGIKCSLRALTKNASLPNLECILWYLFTPSFPEYVFEKVSGIDCFSSPVEYLASSLTTETLKDMKLGADVSYYLLNAGMLGEGKLIWAGHRQETYVSWMYSLSENEMMQLKNDSGHKISVAFKCPIDVRMYDDDGTVVGYISNDKIEIGEPSAVVQQVIDDTKIVEFDENESYTIEIIPRAKGTMTITVELKLPYEESEIWEFQNVDLDINTEYYLLKTSDDDGNNVYTLVNADNKVIGVGESMQNSNVLIEYDVEGNGWVLGCGEKTYNAYVTLTATPDAGESFVGWYLNDELISTDNSYSFFANRSETYTAKFTQNTSSAMSVEVTAITESNIDIAITISDDAELKGNVVVGLYDLDGRLLDAKVYDSENTITDSYPSEGVYTVKVMWFGDLELFDPLSKDITLYVK